MDVLVALSTGISYIYSIVAVGVAMMLRSDRSPATFFDVPPMLITFISLHMWREHATKSKTSEALRKLISLQAKEATLVERDTNGKIMNEKRIDIALVQRGDFLKVTVIMSELLNILCMTMLVSVVSNYSFSYAYRIVSHFVGRLRCKSARRWANSRRRFDD